MKNRSAALNNICDSNEDYIKIVNIKNRIVYPLKAFFLL